MTNDERFRRWNALWPTPTETEFADALKADGFNYDSALGFIGGIESERARVLEIADRIEALPSYRMEIGDDGPYIAPSKDGFYVNTEELFELLKELRS